MLTTEKAPREGGKVICAQPLVWIGADHSNAWKKDPLPLGVPTDCAFRSCIIESLEEVGRDWVDVVASREVNAYYRVTALSALLSGKPLNCYKMPNTSI